MFISNATNSNVTPPSPERAASVDSSRTLSMTCQRDNLAICSTSHSQVITQEREREEQGAVRWWLRQNELLLSLLHIPTHFVLLHTKVFEEGLCLAQLQLPEISVGAHHILILPGSCQVAGCFSLQQKTTHTKGEKQN